MKETKQNNFTFDDNRGQKMRAPIRVYIVITTKHFYKGEILFIV